MFVWELGAVGYCAYQSFEQSWSFLSLIISQHQKEGMAVSLWEQYGGRKETTRTYFEDERGRLAEIEGKKATRNFSLWELFQEVFLPQGYPHSVTEDYMEYQMWDTAQAFASSITGTLATEAVLKGVGVGNETATPLAATVTWLLKDGSGMVGRIVFAWAKGSQLDCNCKQFRLLADGLNDLAIFIDLLAPAFPRHLFTYVVCVSSVCRSLVGVAGGATRAALTQHQAIRNNLADVSAKDGSQETLVNLSALLCSLLFLPLVSGKTLLVWTLFAAFTFFHLFANYKAVRSLKMKTLNRNRFRIVVRHYFSTGSVLDPTAANSQESVLPLPDFEKGHAIKLGCSLHHMSGHYIPKEWTGKNFLLYFSGEKKLCVSLRDRATPEDMLEAVFCAEYHLFSAKHSQFIDLGVLDYAGKYFPYFVSQLKSLGWTSQFNHLNFDEWRFQLNE